MKKVGSQSAFTIVELIIVIVVIAILAAISIVAFTGVQKQAYNSRTIAMVQQAQQALGVYHIDKETYPASGETDTSASCLGSGYPDGKCGFSSFSAGCGGSGELNLPITEYAELNQALKDVLKTNLPAITFPAMGSSVDYSGCTISQSASGVTYSTASYYMANQSIGVSGHYEGSDKTSAYRILYYLQGSDANCAVGEPTVGDQNVVSGWTSCSAYGGDIRRS
jgi:prepilin-type N-terminal cleavage/methylation domain-containing protein